MAFYGITEDDEITLQKASEILRRQRALAPNPSYTDSIQSNSTWNNSRPHEDPQQQQWTSTYGIDTLNTFNPSILRATHNSTETALDIGAIAIGSNVPPDPQNSFTNQQEMSQYSTNIQSIFDQASSTATFCNDAPISDIGASSALPSLGTSLVSSDLSNHSDLSFLNDCNIGTFSNFVNLEFLGLTNDPINEDAELFQGDNTVALASYSTDTLQINDKTTPTTLDQGEVDVAVGRRSACFTSPEAQSFICPLQHNVIETESLPKGEKKRKRVTHTQLKNKPSEKYLACIRCRELKGACLPNPENPGGCCIRCMDLSLKRKHREPCYRIIISSAELIDHSGRPRTCWTLRWTTMTPVNLRLRDWVSKDTKTISITQDIGGTFYDLRVKKFRLRDDDATARIWKTNGVEQRFECTPYAIANMNEAGDILSNYVDSTLLHGMGYYIGRRDLLLTCTYAMAYKYSQDPEASESERDLLQTVLRLWNASRMESRSDRVCSSETLGMQSQEYEPSCTNSGKILLPPVMGAQIEILMTAKILQPAKHKVLKLLKELMKEAHPRLWFTVYLAMFILLHNCALLTESDGKKAQKQGLVVRFFRSALIRELHNGAENIVAHFRWFNEKMSCPFTMDWSSPHKVAGLGFNEEESQFIKNTIVEVKNKAALFQKIHDEGAVENEFYFVSQLFDPELKQTLNIT